MLFQVTRTSDWQSRKRPITGAILTEATESPRQKYDLKHWVYSTDSDTAQGMLNEIFSLLTKDEEIVITKLDKPLQLTAHPNHIINYKLEVYDDYRE